MVLGTVGPEHRRIYTYYSNFTLESVIKKMMEFSNNFIANQICVAMGAQVYGPPGTLNNGVKVISDYAKNELQLNDLVIVEGSGISRENRISAQDMLTVLDRFAPHRHLLTGTAKIRFKTGTLSGVNTRAGYIEGPNDELFSFVVLINTPGKSAEKVVQKLHRAVGW